MKGIEQNNFENLKESEMVFDFSRADIGPKLQEAKKGYDFLKSVRENELTEGNN